MKILSSGTFWGVALFVVAVVTVAVIWIQGRPSRRLIVCSVTVSSLLNKDLSHRVIGGEISVSVGSVGELRLDDGPIRDPFLVELVIENRSRRDVASKDFDRDRPLIFELGTASAQLLDRSGDEYQDHIVINSDKVMIGPCLIRSGSVVQLSFLTEGPPSLTYENPLIDIDIRLCLGN